MKKRAVLFIYLCFCVLVAKSQTICPKPQSATLFDPKQALMISEPEDLMAHCSNFLFYGDNSKHPSGDVFFAYYHDKEQPLEKPEFTSIIPVLVRSHYPELSQFERFDAIHSGETIGSFTQSPKRAPYDPNILIIGDKLYYYIIACVGEEEVVTYAVRPFDITQNKFLDTVYTCSLTYKIGNDSKTVTFSGNNVYAMFDEMGLPNTPSNDVVMTGRFVPYKGEYYCCFGDGFHNRSYPVVVKTKDGYNFEVVMVCKESEWGTCEASVEIMNDEFYVIMRNSFAEPGQRGTFVSKYNAQGHCLVKPQYLSSVQSKPAIIQHNGKLYVFYNAYPQLFTDWGNVLRSRMRVTEIDKNCQLLKSWDITNDVGVHYPYLGHIGKQLFMTFTQDIKKVDIEQVRSTISFTRVDL